MGKKEKPVIASSSTDRKLYARLVRDLFLVAGLAAIVLVLSLALDRGDFEVFYVGGKTVGATAFYGTTAESLSKGRPFHRPPFYALLFYPIAQLPYDFAVIVWRLLNLSLVGLAILLSRADKRTGLALCCCFAPLWWNFYLGQDILVFVVAVLLSWRLLERGSNRAAGMVVSVCAAKFQLFLLVPLVVVAQRRWRLAAGMASGLAAVYFASALVSGWSWPVEYRAVLAGSIETVGSWEWMPTAVGLFYGLPYWPVLVVAVGVAVGAVVFQLASTWKDPAALVLAAAAGLFISPRALVYDASMLLPALLLLCQQKPTLVLVLSTLLGFGVVMVTYSPHRPVGQICSFGLLWLILTWWPWLRLWRSTHDSKQC